MHVTVRSVSAMRSPGSSACWPAIRSSPRRSRCRGLRTTIARSLGLRGIRVDDPEQIGAAWDEALHADRPCVVAFRTDPEVPPLPPHITFEQAKNFMSALVADPARGAMLRNAMKELTAPFRRE
jgi:hypothetical protein